MSSVKRDVLFEQERYIFFNAYSSIVNYDRIVGLNTLAQTQKFGVYVSSIRNKSGSSALRRVREDFLDYDILSNGCQIVSNYISFGIRSSPRTKLIIESSRCILKTLMLI